MSALPASLRRTPSLDAWVRVRPDGGVTVFTGKAEIGQGLRGAIARIAAEELDLALARIEVRTADSAESPNELYTAGSGSMEESGTALRLAAAHARSLLLDRAAERLGVARDSLEVEDGRIRSRQAEVQTSYGELQGGRRFECEVSADAVPKSPDAYRVVGRPGPRIDLPTLATGQPCFVQDLRPPGLLYGRVVRPPSAAARLESIDEDGARSLPGVATVLRDGSFVALAAEREEQAAAAAEALRASARWTPGTPLPQMDEVCDRLLEARDQSLLVVEGTPREGPVPPASEPRGASQTLRARYTRPYHMHASIGPAAALAHFEPDARPHALTVWTASQGVAVLRVALAQVLGMSPEAIRTIHVPGPGCYGHNGADDAALDAALLARAVPGRPVLVQWTREDEHAWEPYGPAMVMALQGSLDAKGHVIDWHHEVTSNSHMGRAIPGGERSNLVAAWHRDPPMAPIEPRPAMAPHAGIHRNADPLYDFPRRRIVKHFVRDAPLRVSSTRGLGAFANVFALESFMDELAHAAGADPVAFRLAHLQDERARAVIEAAAARIGWEERGRGETGRGIAFAQYKNQKAYAAVAILLEVDPDTGLVWLRRAVVAADAGQVIDPDGLANQLEGGVVQAASWTLIEQVRFDEGGVTSRDWDSYPILGFREAPEVEAVLLDQPGQPFLGAGEATQGPTPAAIANAIFDATGARMRQLPFLPERVRDACRAAGSGGG